MFPLHYIITLVPGDLVWCVHVLVQFFLKPDLLPWPKVPENKLKQFVSKVPEILHLVK